MAGCIWAGLMISRLQMAVLITCRDSVAGGSGNLELRGFATATAQSIELELTVLNLTDCSLAPLV